MCITHQCINTLKRDSETASTGMDWTRKSHRGHKPSQPSRLSFTSLHRNDQIQNVVLGIIGNWPVCSFTYVVDSVFQMQCEIERAWTAWKRVITWFITSRPIWTTALRTTWDTKKHLPSFLSCVELSPVPCQLSLIWCNLPVWSVYARNMCTYREYVCEAVSLGVCGCV